MTLLDERLDVLGEPLPEREPVHPVGRGVGSWRLAARLAWREVRHRWGRTIMVTLLIAGPVAGMAFADMNLRASRGTYTNAATLGAADASITFERNNNAP
ncbi:MAG TPA: hypothetical protein VGM78_15350, partial [Ilumatobacteraceae bacterium]